MPSDILSVQDFGLEHIPYSGLSTSEPRKKPIIASFSALGGKQPVSIQAVKLRFRAGRRRQGRTRSRQFLRLLAFSGSRGDNGAEYSARTDDPVFVPGSKNIRRTPVGALRRRTRAHASAPTGSRQTVAIQVGPSSCGRAEWRTGKLRRKACRSYSVAAQAPRTCLIAGSCRYIPKTLRTEGLSFYLLFFRPFYLVICHTKIEFPITVSVG